MTKHPQFLDKINQKARQIRSFCEMSQEKFDIFDADNRIKQVFDPITGFDFFINTYFPHFIRHPSRSQLHEYLFEQLPKIVNSENSVLMATAAPRGEAKSTIVSKLYTLYRIITGTSRYIIIAMDSTDQAYPMLEAIKTELESNARLAIDFPNICGIGRRWQAGTIITRNNIKVEVVGAGKKLRGRSHGAYRPDLVVLDDIENDENVRSPTQRDKLHNWLRNAILKLGGAGEKMDVIYIGTILHYDSVLNRILATVGWRSKKFKAVVRMPDNMALWDEWESIYLADKDDEGNSPLADEFYLANQAELEQGAVVSWLARPIVELMKIRARDGHESFDSEYQNDPTAGDDAPFANAISYYQFLPNDLIYFGSCDPSLGKKGSGRDPSAIVVAGLCRENGSVYIVEANIKKRVPDRIIEDVISMQKIYNCQSWAIEAVQFQEFLKDELVKRSAKQGVPIGAIGVKPNTDKALRIESLQPHMKNGVLLLNPSHTTLIDQFRHFPKADHDDGCDAVEMVFRLATSFQQQNECQVFDIPEPNIWQWN